MPSVFSCPTTSDRRTATADSETQTQAGGSPIVGAGFARRNFGTADGALGRSIFIENRSYLIVGVMPDAMQYPGGVQVWAADSLEPENKNRSGYNYRIVAKLAPAVSKEAADTRLSALANQLASTYPDTNSKRTFVTMPVRDNLIGNVRSTLARTLRIRLHYHLRWRSMPACFSGHSARYSTFRSVSALIICW